MSVLQSDHRFRGIGSVVVNFINNLSESDKSEHSFVFFVEVKDEGKTYEQLKLDGLKYEVRYLHNKIYTTLPGQLAIVSKIFYKALGYIQYLTGDPRISTSDLSDIDRFIQFDQNRKLPRKAHERVALFLHDLIPYVLEADYLWSFKTARLHGKSFKGSVKSELLRFQYMSRLKINAKRARTLIANSEYTKKDFVKYLNLNPSKISVAQLGVNTVNEENEIAKPSFIEYRTTMWGTVTQEFDPQTKPFILFMGGTDFRRKMVDLLAAFNNIRARGFDVSLVLSGDSLEGIEDIKNPIMKSYIQNNTSYLSDIHLLGYVDNIQRDWLYKNTLAFIFPSVYEGFGLPVLEAMSHRAAVITYDNTAITEVAGKSVLYADSFLQIAEHVTAILDNPKSLEKIKQLGVARAQLFTWEKTKDKILKALSR